MKTKINEFLESSGMKTKLKFTEEELDNIVTGNANGATSAKLFKAFSAMFTRNAELSTRLTKLNSLIISTSNSSGVNEYEKEALQVTSELIQEVSDKL